MYVYYLPKNTRLDRNAATVVATFIQVAIQLLSRGLSGTGHPKYSCLMFHYNIYFFYNNYYLFSRGGARSTLLTS